MSRHLAALTAAASAFPGAPLVLVINEAGLQPEQEVNDIPILA